MRTFSIESTNFHLNFANFCTRHRFSRFLELAHVHVWNRVKNGQHSLDLVWALFNTEMTFSEAAWAQIELICALVSCWVTYCKFIWPLSKQTLLKKSFFVLSLMNILLMGCSLKAFDVPENWVSLQIIIVKCQHAFKERIQCQFIAKIRNKNHLLMGILCAKKSMHLFPEDFPQKLPRQYKNGTWRKWKIQHFICFAQWNVFQGFVLLWKRRPTT